MYLYALFKVIKSQKTLSFLFYVLVLLTVSNAAEICYTAILKVNNLDFCFDESNKCDSTNAKILLLCIFDYIRYLTWMLAIWAFSFKYWVVSIEIPKILSELGLSIRQSIHVNQDSKQVLKERKFQVIFWFGVLANFVFTTWWSIEFAHYLGGGVY